jgi:Apea-like HEPN
MTMTNAPPMSHEALKAKQRALRDGFHENLGLRIHRALSWLRRAELAEGDPDARFIFLWIAFNAAYAEDVPDGTNVSERSVFDGFFVRILGFDNEQKIYNAIWKRFTGPIRLLLDNRYVFQPFWNHHNGLDGYGDWEERFNKSKTRLHQSLVAKDTRLVLSTVFDRLYVLRNQLIHGGATWDSSVNRSQIRDGVEILNFLVPIFIRLMMDNPHAHVLLSSL